MPRLRFLSLLVSVALLLLGVAVAHAGSLAPKLVGGTWYRHLDTMSLHADGTFEGWERGHEEPRRGTWALRGRRLTLREGGRRHVHRVVAVTPKHLRLTFSDGSGGLDYRRAWD